MARRPLALTQERSLGDEVDIRVSKLGEKMGDNLHRPDLRGRVSRLGSGVGRPQHTSRTRAGRLASVDEELRPFNSDANGSLAAPRRGRERGPACGAVSGTAGVRHLQETQFLPMNNGV